MKRFKILILLVISLFIFAGCNKDRTEALESVKISNIATSKDRDIVKLYLKDAGISEEIIEEFLKNVFDYNIFVNHKLPFADGFTEVKDFKVDYNDTVDEFYKKENRIGSNCRINTYLLDRENIKINRKLEDNSSILAFDKASIESEFSDDFDETKKSEFQTLFAPVPAAESANKDDQIKKIEETFKERGISFADSKARMINVWFHDNNDIDGNILFIGHTGILVPYQNKLMFIEKLSFNEPYQAVVVKNERELSDYLMGKYDVEYNQNTTRPFIMDGMKLLKDFRQNPNNK
ncbi:DUF4300 family protein [Peptoniphilus sp. MSJ-1]|uniref:DUF4300 family protein n=1 Tax=Peptoniphilus ovalis TaxID=2841503 RepID=A0ABS6FE34_9FIRM|nr:DUF4300 family protein [Peptoniphilus ovalis]MBU5668451.1 DUF4300 family protein [Peptoniphilus ovalis]